MNKNIKQTQAIITSITQSTPKIKVFNLALLVDDFHFLPGQWIDIILPFEGKNIGGFTITSSNLVKNQFDLAIRESKHPVTNYMYHQAKVGEKILINYPQGKFYLSPDFYQQNLAFIAGGIGLTPILSMIRSLPDKNKLHLFYSVSDQKDFLFVEELKSFTSFIVTKNHEPEFQGSTKRLDLDFIKSKIDIHQSKFFICGPKSMIDELNSSLKSAGVNPTNIYFEKWW